MAEENKETQQEEPTQGEQQEEQHSEVKEEGAQDLAQEAEQTQQEEQADQGEQTEQIDPEDLMAMWEDALKEAGQSESKEESEPQASPEPAPEAEPAQSQSVQSQPAKLEELSPEKSAGPPPELDFILDIPLEVSVEIGRTKMLIKDLLKLNQGSIIELEKFAGEPVEVYVNGKLMAKGEVIVVNDKFGVRITEIVSAHERVKKLGS